MNRNFASSVVWITALTYAAFAIWLGTRPDALLEAFGIMDRTPAMSTEIRAFYGGVEIGLTVAMLVLWNRSYIWPALLVGALPLLGSASGRCIGMILDGYSSIHAVFAGFEFIGFALCVTGMLLVKERASVKASD